MAKTKTPLWEVEATSIRTGEQLFFTIYHVGNGDYQIVRVGNLPQPFHLNTSIDEATARREIGIRYDVKDMRFERVHARH